MKVLIWSDLHLDQYKPFSTIYEGGINSRLYDQVKVVKAVAEIAKEEKVDAIFFLGDLINPMGEGLAKSVYNAVFYTATTLAQIAPSYYIIGNHDIYRGVHVLSALEAIEGVFLVKETSRVCIDGVDIDLVPWNQKLPGKERAKILLGHMEVQGAQVHLGVPYIGGRLPSEFKGYDYAYLGHFHTQQEIGVEDAKEAKYVGAVMACQFGDTDEDRGVHIFDGVVSSFHKITSPKFKQCRIDSQESWDYFLLSQGGSEDFYRVTITNPDVKPEPLRNVQIMYDIKPEHKGRMEIGKSESLSTILKRFIDESKWDGDKEKAKELLDEVSKEAGA